MKLPYGCHEPADWAGTEILVARGGLAANGKQGHCGPIRRAYRAKKWSFVEEKSK